MVAACRHALAVLLCVNALAACSAIVGVGDLPLPLDASASAPGDDGSGVTIDSAVDVLTSHDSALSDAVDGVQMVTSDAPAADALDDDSSPSSAIPTETGSPSSVSASSADAGDCGQGAEGECSSADASICSGDATDGSGCPRSCRDSCAPGKVSCGAGGIQICVLGADGCYELGAAEACASPQEVCRSDGGSATCSCEASAPCTAVGPNCSGASLVVCAEDGEGCLYKVSSSTCPAAMTCQGGACVCPSGTRNCNGQCVSTASITWHADADGDGYGNPNASIVACTQPAGYVADATDCCDSDGNAHPGQTSYFATVDKCGSWDYDCNKQIEFASSCSPGAMTTCRTVGFFCNGCPAGCTASAGGCSCAESCGCQTSGSCTQAQCGATLTGTTYAQGSLCCQTSMFDYVLQCK